MHILVIDVGSYSVKYLSSFVDKRRISHVEMSEVILRDFMNDHEELSLPEAQTAIVQELIDNIARPDTKVIYQIDNALMTTRFITLPVKSKKKAEQMLPFQIEEDIPFSLNEIHYAYRLESQKTQNTAIVELLKENVFEEFYESHKEKNCLPNVLTTEASIVENYFNQNPMAGPFCVLDIGHTTTKSYFFYNSRLLMSHTSYVGGQNINDMIGETYKIDQDEAIIYKHQNAFVLTSTQYDDVDVAQKEFATAMDKVLAPLVSDFARWKVGFKVNFGLSTQHIFICGGSANIKNMTNYLTEKWGIKVSLLESFNKVESEKIDINAKNKSKYTLANMMAIGFRRKNRFINLLIGRFAQAGLAEIPLHSLAFIGVRVVTATAVLMLSLIAENFFIKADIKAVNAKISTLLKNPDLQISGRLSRQVALNAKPVYDQLMKKQKNIRQEISTLQSAIQIKALSPLVVVSQIAASSKATLIHFESNNSNEITAIFTSESVEELNELKSQFERSTLSDTAATVDAGKMQLTIKAIGN